MQPAVDDAFVRWYARAAAVADDADDDSIKYTKFYCTCILTRYVDRFMQSSNFHLR